MKMNNWTWFVTGYERTVLDNGIIRHTPTKYSLSICPYRSNFLTVPIDTPIDNLDTIGFDQYKKFIDEEYRRLNTGAPDETE